MMHTPGPRENVLTILLFALALGLPLAYTNWHPGWARGIENRALALRPVPFAAAPRLEPWLKSWEDFLRDHFGGRDAFIRAFHRGHLALFGCSAVPDVAAGTDGWLYYVGDRGRDALHGTLPKDDALDRWTTWLEDRSAWLADRGTPFLFVSAPDKQTIYPEHLPRELRPSPGRTRLDALLERLAAVGVPHVDLRPALREARGSALLYWTADSHWNHRAASRAADVLLTRLARNLPLRDAAPPRFEPEAPHTCDLAEMLGMSDLVKSPSERAVPPPPALKSLDAPPPGPGPRVLVLHDSFGDFARFFPPRVDTVARQTDDLDPFVLETVRPDFVLLEIVERKLNAPPRADRAVFGEDRALRRAFLAAQARRSVPHPLPPLSLPPGQHAVLRAVLERDETGLAVLTARTPTRQLNTQHQARQGRSVIYLTLGADEPVDALHFHVMGRGTTRVISLELATGLSAAALH